MYPYLYRLIPTYTDLYQRGISLDIPLQESYPWISQNNFPIPTYTGISQDKSQFGLSPDIPVKVGIWQGVVFPDDELWKESLLKFLVVSKDIYLDLNFFFGNCV